MSSKLLRCALLGMITIGAAGCTSTSSATTYGAPLTSAASMVAPAAYGSPSPSGAVASNLQTHPYFIDFRSRAALSYGHSFVVFGKRDANGNVPTDRNGVLIPGLTEVAGLHPASTSNIPYTIGHVMFVPSETGPSDGDSESQYMTAHYQINLTEAQYRDTVAYIRHLQANSPLWHAVLYNCSAFDGRIASHLGLETPNPILFPENYIHEMRKLNGGRSTVD